MFASLGRFLAGHRYLVVVISALSLLVAIIGMVTVSPNLSSEGFISETAESARVDEIVADEFGRGGDSLIFLFDADHSVDDPAVRGAIEETLAPLGSDPRFAAVLTTWSTGNPRMVDADGSSTFAVVMVAPGVTLGDGEIAVITDQVSERAASLDLSVMTGGGTSIGAAISHEVEAGIIRAEIVTVPLAILIQLAVFGSLVAAGIPVLIGALAIVASIALILLLSTEAFQSIFAINIITMLGLGLGIDYSLFMVTRFREEIAHRPTTEALVVTMATVGKAIFFSGITVVLGLAGTQFFPLPALKSMGQAGMLVTALALVYGLTLLPAILAILGGRVNALSIRRHAVRTQGAEGGFWHRIANVVMRRPVTVLVTVLALLLIAGLPVLRLDLTPGGPEILPAHQEPRIVSERLASEFPQGDADPVPVLITVEDGDPFSAENVELLRHVVDRLQTMPGVTRVESFVAQELAAETGFDWAGYDGNPAMLPPQIEGTAAATTRGDQVLVHVTGPDSGGEAERLVRDIRELDSAALDIEVGGYAGATVDTLDGIRAGLVPAAAFVFVGSYVMLLLTFGSVLLPLKAMFMTLLSISASLGAVVFVFQDGNFERIFRFEATGEIISTTPILMFCILFGLSMDYEVLMLSRIQEEYERTGDNRASVAFGLSQTARVITGAAAIMVVVFGGFMLADIVVIKSMGFGLALAVLIDATIVRGLLVPATMRMMGRWNWWAPAPVHRLVVRLGLAHSAASPASSVRL
jgi:uncharacterized membrane protein YdfJ with MMPL/SSD domain